MEKEKRINTAYIITLNDKPLRQLQEDLLLLRSNKLIGFHNKVFQTQEWTKEEYSDFIEDIEEVDEAIENLNSFKKEWINDDNPLIVCSNLTICSKLCQLYVQNIDKEKLPDASYKRMYNHFQSGKSDYKIHLYIYRKSRKIQVAHLIVSKRKVLTSLEGALEYEVFSDKA